MAEETTFRKLRHALLELLKGYPEYMYWGKFESYLKSGKKGVEILHKHGIIEKIPLKEVKKKIKEMSEEELKKLPQGEDRFLWYRLTAKGVDLAISVINLEQSERVLEHSKRTLIYNESMRKFTIVVIVATIGALIFSFVQALISLWF
jgi:hypothetical protein